MSQKLQILEWLKAGHCVDAMTGIRKFGTTRLAARVAELRLAGWDIQTTMVKVHTRDGTARVAVYKMAAA